MPEHAKCANQVKQSMRPPITVGHGRQKASRRRVVRCTTHSTNIFRHHQFGCPSRTHTGTSSSLRQTAGFLGVFRACHSYALGYLGPRSTCLCTLGVRGKGCNELKLRYFCRRFAAMITPIPLLLSGARHDQAIRNERGESVGEASDGREDRLRGGLRDAGHQAR